MLTRRTLTSLVAVTALAVPGLAIAQSADDLPTEVVTEDPTEQPTEQEATEEATDQESEDESEQRSLQQEDLEAEDREDLTVAEEGEDEGHGDVVSTLAQCLPSGAELHGTGLTRGAIVSQVASTGEVTGFEGIETLETPEDATALCEQVQALADEADAPDRAKGRPDWAGPKGDDGEGDVAASADGDAEAEGSRGRGGPPDHARARGRG